MSIPAFSNLKEIQSLDNMIKKHLDIISAEEERLGHIDKLREKARSEIESLTKIVSGKKENSQKLEKDLFAWDQKLAKAQENIPFAKNEKEINALESDYQTADKNVNELQEAILTLLEEIEESEHLINEKKEFLEGSLKTLNEIKNEVMKKTEGERNEIHNYELRVEQLKEEIPPPLWDIFAQARKKHRFNLPLARIINKSCEKCRFMVDAQTAARVESGTGYEQCSQCERLLIPLET